MGAALGLMSDRSCAVFKMSLMSLNEGATNLRDEMARAASCTRKASSNARGVKKVEMVGTSILSLDLEFVL